MMSWPMPTKGTVTVEDYGNLKIRYDNEAVLDRGFIMEGNATLDVDRNDEQ